MYIYDKDIGSNKKEIKKHMGIQLKEDIIPPKCGKCKSEIYVYGDSKIAQCFECSKIVELVRVTSLSSLKKIGRLK